MIGRCIICPQARYHLPGEKNPLLIWFCCEFSFGAGIPRKSASKYGAQGPLLLLDEVDFVNVRLDSRNLDCQPLNPWTSMAARNALGPAFYRRSRLADLLNHPQEFLAEIEQYSLTSFFA